MALSNPVKIQVPFCENGNRAEIPIEAPTTTEEANYASYNAGFPPITMIPTEANGIPPRGVDFNGILYDLSSNIQNWNAGVQMRFDENFCNAIGGYPLGAVLQSDDGKRAYVSVKANNTGNFNTDSTLIGVDWILYGGGGEGGSLRFAVADGTSEAITANFATPVIDLEDGTLVVVQATAANITTTPSFAPNGLAAATIVKGANKPLAVGDIEGAGYLAMLQYSANYGRWVLQNPATGINVVIPPSMPVGSTYVQFAGMAAPADLFGGTWSNISSTFAGLFFRAEGGDAASFGSSQTGGLPNLEGTLYSSYFGRGIATKTGVFANSHTKNNGTKDSVDSSVGIVFNAASGNSLYGAATEVRPVNSTIRIWKRTA